VEGPGKTDWPLRDHLLPFTKGRGPFELASKPLARTPELCHAAKDDVAYLHHTSGTSAGVPKPIPQTHFAGAGVYARFDGSQHATFTTTPLYHGGVADLFRAWTSNALIWLFPGKGVPITATNIIKCLDLAKKTTAPPVKYFASVPYVLEMMACDKRGVECLRDMDIVAVGGAALPSTVGDHLVDEGVNLISRFGSAECGFLMSSHREYEKDRGWDYLRSQGGLCFEERDGGVHELIVPPEWPYISKTDKVSPDGSFATKDLFQRHPNIAHAWIYHSRADSQLTMLTGKKFDPAPLEDALAVKSSLIQDVLIFGNGRPCPGALLFRSAEAADMPDDELLSNFASAVDEINMESQIHARIPRSMLVIMPYFDTPLEKSSKGTVLRRLAEERYATDINGAYEKKSSDGINVPDAEVDAFVLDIVRSITNSSGSGSHNLQLDTDLFAYGVDSVACLQIRQAVFKLLPTHRARLPFTIVQNTGSVRKLSQALIDIRHDRVTREVTDHAEMMRSFVKEHSQISAEIASQTQISLPTPPRTPSPPQEKSGKTVLLTGATGSLGSQLLSKLIPSPEISHIHLLLRGTSSETAEERVRDALFSRKIPLPADFDRKVSIHVCNLSEAHLGLSAETYGKLVQEVDLIFHLAWAVDFTLPLPGFQQHFEGLKGLLELSLAHSKYSPDQSPPRAARLIFCSSTASASSFCQLHAREKVPEVVLTNTDYSGGIGYSQSKWVAENICLEAVRAHPELHGAVSVVRVGQLSGDSIHGVWNRIEAYPLMMSSAKWIGCLPDLPRESVGWLPVDTAATAFLELGLGVTREESPKVEDVRVFHVLCQDRTTTWGELLGWLRDAGDEPFDVVTAEEWLHRLEQLSNSADEADAGAPCLKLLGFWKMAYGGVASGEATMDVYAMEKSVRDMPVLRTLKGVDREYALKLWGWIRENV
jgi:thioester reductase-like protein